MDGIERDLKIMQFLATFNEDVKVLTAKLIQRYKDKPTEPADIVFSTVVTIVARIICGVVPPEQWEHCLFVLAQGVAKHKQSLRNKKRGKGE